tara:strand:- start:468 stop:1763 length:1296 start_codon:yes stop_codon:yes gene_type:complete
VNRKLKVLDLFSGIGGFALGLDSTGFFETVRFVEKDKYCQKVLQKNFPNIPIEEDIKNVEGKEYSADVVVGGFPCQPFSVAGKQKGTNDDRYLWPEMLRLIREIKPEFVIGENVQGIINLQNGMVLRQVQDELESEGFEVQCFLIPASGIGAWHQRYRVWIVGHSQHNGLLAAEKRCRDEKDYGGSQKGQNETIEFERTSRSRDNEDVSNTNNTRGGASEHGIEREGQKADEGWKGQSQSESSRHDEDVSNTDTRLGIGENEEIQARRETIDSSSSRGSEDVSNTNSSMRGGGRTITHGGENKVWRFRVEEERNGSNLRSETIGRDAVSREDVSNTNGEGLQGCGVSTNLETEQRTIGAKDSVEEQQTWWQIESDLCGVPNGISYELDKDRANRIKTLGNAIVPQIAREFGLAIKKVLSDSDSDGQGGQQF